MLVLGSHEWNTPAGADGAMKCNKELQDRILEAARRTGGGALHIVPAHSTHHSFGDFAFLFGDMLQPLNRLVRASPAQRASPAVSSPLFHPAGVQGPRGKAASPSCARYQLPGHATLLVTTRASQTAPPSCSTGLSPFLRWLRATLSQHPRR